MPSRSFPELDSAIDYSPEGGEPTYIGDSAAVGAGHESDSVEDFNSDWPTGTIKPSFNSGPNGVSKGFDA
jgi:hypothetical protein